jgi:hypothetical protein
VSRTRRSRDDAAERGGTERGTAAPDPAPRAPWWRTFVVQVGVLAAVFAVTVVVAELAGAANLGVALGVGQIVFALALMYLLLRR